MQTKELDKKFLARDMPAENLEIVNSNKSLLIDSKGRKYIDFLMGWCVGNVGWGNKHIKNKIAHYKGPDYVRPEYLFKPWAKLAEILAHITPGRLQKSFRATGGTEAIEIALQAAMSYTKRCKFISVEGSYHGHSLGALSIGSSYFRSWYNNLLPHCYKINPPLDGRAVKKLEGFLKQGDIAALVMEPIICSLGVEIPTNDFMRCAQSLCKQYGALLIADEVATGFGRTGKLFAAEHFNLEPDIMCLAKGITGGYGGLGATIVTEEIARSMQYEFSYFSTYGWHPLSTEIAIANIEYILGIWKELEQSISRMEKYFLTRLSKMNFKYKAKIRVKGLAIGVEFENDDYASRIVAKARKLGVLFAMPSKKAFVIFPALNIEQSTASLGLDMIEQCL